MRFRGSPRWAIWRGVERKASEKRGPSISGDKGRKSSLWNQDCKGRIDLIFYIPRISKNGGKKKHSTRPGGRVPCPKEKRNRSGYFLGKGMNKEGKGDHLRFLLVEKVTRAKGLPRVREKIEGPG